jgi:hypothetical protein
MHDELKRTSTYYPNIWLSRLRKIIKKLGYTFNQASPESIYICSITTTITCTVLSSFNDKAVPVHAMKTYRGKRCTAPPILNLSAMCR